MREGVFRLLTFCFSAACLASFVWFGLTVDLGDHTLFGHIRAIGSTPEAKQLGEGIKTKVDDFVGIEAARRAAAEAARKAEGKSPDKSPEQTAGPPQDDHSAADREGLRKVAKPTNTVKKSAPAARPAPTRPAAAPARPASAPRPATTPRQGARPQPAAAVRRVAEAGPAK
jgi:hypothetical protein